MKLIQVLTAAYEDKARIRELWDLCFGDSQGFKDWFFTERFFPELSSVLKEDGVIMSALQSYPLHVRIRDSILPASMLAGVSTHPERGGRGYMKQIFQHYMERVYESGTPIVVHTPARLATFFSMGHYPATDTLYITITETKNGAMPPEVVRQSMLDGLAPLQACYQKATARYSGSVSRTMGDFSYKFRDYASDGGQCMTCRVGDDVLGYCMFYAMQEEVHVEECFALDMPTLYMLLDALQYEAAGRKLHIKLPPDVLPPLDPVLREATVEKRPQGVMGVANIGQLLYLLVRDSSFTFEVMDATVPQNAGVWDGMGKTSRRAPQMRLPAGRLGQFLAGYCTLAELVEEGHAEAFDPAAVQALDRILPKCACFITDEY